MNNLFQQTMKILFGLLVMSSSIVKAHEDDIVFSTISKKLPIGISDMTATYVPDYKGSGVEAIILAGGCSAENGNSKVVEEYDGKNVTNFYCSDITDRAFVFYPSTQNIEEIQSMPYKVYRHSAAYVDGKLYIIGGRTFNIPESNFDELVKKIIEFDPMEGDKGSWSEFDVPSFDDFAASDQTSFARGGSIYTLGGYSADYGTKDTFFSINVESRNILSLKSMITKRGDANAAYYKNGNMESVFIMGGFSSETSKPFCEPLSEAERYDFSTNKWTSISPLVNQRGDKGVVVLNDAILAIGGEDKHESICSGVDEVEASSHAVVVDDVESYYPQDGDDAKWEVELDFAETRFRSAAAVAESTDTVYVFGGQMAYDVNCECYKTSSDIFSYRETHAHPHSSAFGRKIVNTVIGISVASILSTM